MSDNKILSEEAINNMQKTILSWKKEKINVGHNPKRQKEIDAHIEYLEKCIKDKYLYDVPKSTE